MSPSPETTPPAPPLLKRTDASRARSSQASVSSKPCRSFSNCRGGSLSSHIPSSDRAAISGTPRQQKPTQTRRASMVHPQTGGFRLANFDLDEIVEKRRGGAEVGQRRTDRRVAILAVGHVLVPPDAERDDDTALDGFSDNCTSPELTAVIENADRRTVVDTARAGVGGVNLECRFAGGPAQHINVDEARVEERRVRRTDHLQRVLSCKIRPRLRILGGRSVIRQRIAALRREPRAVEFALARGRAKGAAGECGIVVG